MLFLATGQAEALPPDCGTHYHDSIRTECRSTIYTGTTYFTGTTLSRTNTNIDQIYASNSGYEVCRSKWPKVAWNLTWSDQSDARYASAGGSAEYTTGTCLSYAFVSTGGSHLYDIDGDSHWHRTSEDVPHPQRYPQ